ncbi:hypothetical protein CPB84DRAFT_673932 [Gymnopilus junonius]|uniref:DUF6533 domain-containing protein n=1 Tax=Gymnopilus junonius TaxID=109634 RepID=A0A9P5NT31_GYMJU|nr:hypothetical protein CPB84DRAFT_673932 [Gymnopilus junonius]
MSALLFWSRANVSQPFYSPYRSEGVAAGAQAVNRSSVAALTFLLWDILITMDDEVKYIWSRAWSYTKCIYFFVRYLPVMVQISILFIGTELTPHFHFTPHDCYIWQIYQGVAASSVVVTVDTVLILRIHALYHGHLAIRRVVGVFFLLEIVGMVVGLALSLPGVTFDNLCLVVHVPGPLILYGASSIVFQSFLFSLTVYKYMQAARSGWGDVPLIILLMRDGTWAFFLLFVVYVGQIGLYALPKDKDPFAGVLFGWLLTAFSFSGYRILINLNHLAENTNGSQNRTSNIHRTDTNIQFSTQIFDSQRQTYAQGESYELTPFSLRGRDSRTGGRTFETSQISTLSLGK